MIEGTITSMDEQTIKALVADFEASLINNMRKMKVSAQETFKNNEDQKEPLLKGSFAFTASLGESKFRKAETKLSWSTRYTAANELILDDEDQAKLPFEGVTVEGRGGDPARDLQDLAEEHNATVSMSVNGGPEKVIAQPTKKKGGK